MAKTYPAKWFNESMQGASQTGDNDAGTMIALLKACLVDGFGALAPETIVFDSETAWAKASFSAGHSYLKHSIISCSGSIPTEYNGEHRVMQVTTNDMWFELDSEPATGATGSLEIKIAPLGWEITHQNTEQNIIIFKPAGNLGNVSLRVDNSPYSGWSGTYARLMKVETVENVTDVNTYELIKEHIWPASGKYSDHKWDLVGDSRIIFFMPEYGTAKNQAGFYAGYIDTIRPGDNYHFWSNSLGSTAINDRWDRVSSSDNYYTTFLANNVDSLSFIARGYHQVEGTVDAKKMGFGVCNSDVLSLPNKADNGFYINAEPAMLLETQDTFRGTIPLMVAPLSNNFAYHRRVLQELPNFPGKMFHLLQSTYSTNASLPSSLVGFDVSTVEV